eukprot:CAMPEP_0173390510 /NCGR_PEP_ID=MMETSP1356-20130122/15113_1 /TAXON_ID=77927 ORGANISM="Hemiselmis virescens, Strain PCC157" /NCGR_SAMPLE_ID=MMETSP1356 /ASSEMBLY_ACC=CAM_ASM_000847 /LENGTH=560 /DNA_ID=CAMNT_0014347921 /DNA_START=196 /DNA_END=1874 /DNA_ORIENTATION=+
MADMTAEALQQITKEMKQYQTPSLNDKMYLHFKGWKKLEPCLREYSGVKALWLEGNGLAALEHLDTMTELRCLYTQQNCLESLEGLEHNVLLDSINATNNSIRTISHISHLTGLHTLQVANNRLCDAADIVHLCECPSLGVLDLQNNKLEDPQCLEVLASLPDLRVLQLQGNPLTRKIKHYRKTVIARLRELTYLDDRPVFEDERRTTRMWAQAGASHKAPEGGEVDAVMIAEALADGTFSVEKAHEAEKAERAAIREEKDAKDKRNRESFQKMLYDARMRRIAHVLNNVRLFEGLSEDCVLEMAAKCASNPVHTNMVVGFAKEEVCLHAGAPVQGLYFVGKGKVQFSRQDKPCYESNVLHGGQYFGENSLCTTGDMPAGSDVVAKDYSELYLLSRDDVLDVADQHEGAMDVLQRNRGNALRVQWHECKPWRAYELVHSTNTFIVAREGMAPPSAPGAANDEDARPRSAPGEQYPIEWYGKNELAKSVPESADEADEINPDGISGDHDISGDMMADEYKESWARVQENKRLALAEAGLTEAEFVAQAEARKRGEDPLVPT